MGDPRRKKFECEECDRVYFSWEGLSQHKQSHLGKTANRVHLKIF